MRIRRAARRLDASNLAGIRGGHGMMVDPHGNTVKHGMMVDPSGQHLPQPDTGTVKHGMMVDPNG